MTTQRYTVESLKQLAAALFAAAGMDAGKARAVAEVLVAGDMVGQRTHGMALCPQYLEQIEKGMMATSGEPDVVRDSGAVFVWDGNYLPGPWLVSRALDQARALPCGSASTRRTRRPSLANVAARFTAIV